jgi:hypothetical protein
MSGLGPSADVACKGQGRHRIFRDGSEDQAVSRDDLEMAGMPLFWPSFSRQVSTLSIATSWIEALDLNQPGIALFLSRHLGRGCDKLLSARLGWPEADENQRPFSGVA